MANEGSATSYEDARKQRLLENKKRIEDLGLLKLAKNLLDKKEPEKSQQRLARPKPAANGYLLEPRRSSRPRNSVSSYRDDIDVELPILRKRSKSSSSWASYLARPAEEVKTATYEERRRAFKSAEKLQSNLQSGNPSFVKSMLRSHVYSCFWLGLPTKFCEDYLPKSTTDMVLENEEGAEYEAIFISKRTGVSGGWRAFALDHKLDDGDALVFELVEPTRFKIYIVRAFDCEDEDDKPVLEVESHVRSKETKKGEKIDGRKMDNSNADKTSRKNKVKSSEKKKPQEVSATRRSSRLQK